MATTTEDHWTESSRLASFKTAQKVRRLSTTGGRAPKPTKWPHSWLAPAKLAAAGFYYAPTTEALDNVICFLCQSAICGWEENDCPFTEHFHLNPTCGWAITSCVEQKLVGLHEENPMSSRMVKARKDTFGVDGERWPHETKRGWKCKVRGMVEAGWRFKAMVDEEDWAECVYCTLALDGWQAGDKPFHEHHARSADCAFFALCSKSESPIAKRAAASSSTSKKLSRPSRASRLSTQSALTEAPSFANFSVVEEGDSALTTSSTVAKKMPAKGKKTAVKKGKKKVEQVEESILEQEEVLEVEDLSIPMVDPPAIEESVVDEPEPKPVKSKAKRGKKRASEDVEACVVGPAPKRRTRGSMAVADSIIADNSVLEESAVFKKSTRGVAKKGRTTKSTRKTSTASTVLDDPEPEQIDEDLDRKLEAELDRQLQEMDVEEALEYIPPPSSKSKPEPEPVTKKPSKRATRSSKITSADRDHSMFEVPPEISDSQLERELEEMEMEEVVAASKPLPKTKRTSKAAAGAPRKVSAKQSAAAKKRELEEERKRAEAEAAAEAERVRAEEEAEAARQAEIEAQRFAAEEAEAERLRLEVAAEAERLRLEQEEAERLRIKQEEAEAEAERLRIEQEEAKAEQERMRAEAEAEAERLKAEKRAAKEEAKREKELAKQKAAEVKRAKAAAAAERKRAEEEERRRQEEQKAAAAAEAERLRIEEEEAVAEAERLRLEEEAASKAAASKSKKTKSTKSKKAAAVPAPEPAPIRRTRASLRREADESAISEPVESEDDVNASQGTVIRKPVQGKAAAPSKKATRSRKGSTQKVGELVIPAPVEDEMDDDEDEDMVDMVGSNSNYEIHNANEDDGMDESNPNWEVFSDATNLEDDGPLMSPALIRAQAANPTQNRSPAAPPKSKAQQARTAAKGKGRASPAPELQHQPSHSPLRASPSPQRFAIYESPSHQPVPSSPLRAEVRPTGHQGSARKSRDTLTPSPSPQSSDAENRPPSSRPATGARGAPGTPSFAYAARAPLAQTPTGSPSKRRGGGLQSAAPWTEVDLDAVFGHLRSPEKENQGVFSPGRAAVLKGVERARKGELSEGERDMSVEEWVKWNALEAEERLKSECERLVGVFEREGTRAMRTLEGINPV